MTCKNIIGYDGRYEIDREGNIFSNVRTRKQLKTKYNDKYDYYYIVLHYKNKHKKFRIDELVTTHFIDTDDINEKDDNQVENVESINPIKKYKIKKQIIDKNSCHITYDDMSKNWLFQIRINRKLIFKYLKTEEEAIEYKKEFLKSILTDEVL